MVPGDLRRMETKIKAIRAGNRAAVTRLLKTFEELESSPEAIEAEELKQLEDALKQKQAVLRDLNERLIETLADEDIEQEIASTDEYMYNLESRLRQIRKMLHSITLIANRDEQTHVKMNVNADSFTPRMATCNTNSSAAENSEFRNTANSHVRHETCTETRTCNIPHQIPSIVTYNRNTENYAHATEPTYTCTTNNHRLPKLDLPHFDGNVLEWSTFWDTYETVIHFNSSLTPVQKFSYLKAQLLGPAAHTISGFALSHANYDTAVNLLKERFGRPQKIINSYMKALMAIPSPANELTSLRNYGDSLESYIRGLECLGQTQEMYGALLVPVVISKLPVDIRKNIAREYDTDDISLKMLRKAIMKEVRVLEVGEFSDTIEASRHISTATFHAAARNSRSHVKSDKHNTHPNKKKTYPTCTYCTESHFPGECTKVTDVNERLKIVKQKKLCFNCLRDHRVVDCKSSKKCKKCNKKHHTSICGAKQDDEKPSSAGTSVSRTDEATTSVMYAAHHHKNVLLKTAIAPISYGPSTADANILFDEGAQRSFIVQSLATKLQLTPSGRETIELSAFGDTSKNVRHLDVATIKLQTVGGEQLSITALIVPDIAVPLQNQVQYVKRSLPYLKDLRLAHPMTTDDTFEISLLIGADYYWDVIEDKVIRGQGPTAVASKLGYLLSGPITGNSRKSATSSVLLNVISSHQDDDLNIERFWNLESLGIRSPQLDEDESFLKTYQQNSIKFESGHYTAALPWKLDHPDLPSNIAVAKARTVRTVTRLFRDSPTLLQKYTDIIEEQEKRGFIEKVEEVSDKVQNVHYIPHHAVKKESTTTPIRIVYDCSSKMSQKFASLNECLMSVPPDLNDLTKILIRFRHKRYAISTDIEKAFLHIGLDEKDRDYTRFFWLKDPSNPTTSDLQTYRFKSILFGATCSPFILNATLMKHLEKQNTEVSAMMKQDLYVDNIMSSVNTETEVRNYFHDARNMMLQAGFNLRSWSSNSQTLREDAKQQNVLETDTVVKILGLRWDSHNDTIAFQKIKLRDVDVPNVTKREILRQSSRLYDPLGFLSPVSIRAKIMMQELWKEKFAWDEKLPLELQNNWATLADDLEKSTATELNRQYFINNFNKETNSKLHVFMDASEKAYGACIYLCNGDESSLVMAKSRVAPIKQLTLPQLELMAALIGARLGEHVNSTLGIDDVTFWSDSQIALQWISTQKQLKRFIRNRVTEIRELTNGHKWRYCPTSDNPADLLTRGLTHEQFENNQLWFHGPKWILNQAQWPEWKAADATILLTGLETVKSNTTPTTQNNQETGIQRVVNIDRYNSLQKLLRVTSYVNRFIRNCRVPRVDRIHAKFATTDELQASTKAWIVSCQNAAYVNEITFLRSQEKKCPNLVKQLKLYLENETIIRCGGRIQNAPVCDNTKFPYLLPRDHQFTRLIVLDTHRTLMHAGVLTTVTQLRQTYWIPQIRQCVKGILRNCINCRKLTSKPYTSPDPPPLPKDRLSEAPPFTITGVDFTGALYIKDKHETSKVFICLFTCASTRAIHLEIVPDLTEGSFLQAFRRFISRKSRPRKMISDNATTYLAASETIRRLTHSTVIHDTLSSYGTTWTFIPKRAPWYGGWWERLIGVTKNCLRKTLGRSLVTLVTLQTIVTEIEAIINDRPLTYLPTDICDEEPLTPSHLLYGRRITVMPYPQQELSNDIDLSRPDFVKRRNTLSTLLEHFRNRWKSEYLTSLREYHNQSGNNRQTIRVGDVVQVHDDKQPRSRWNIAIIDELITGNDGLIRSAVIRTNNGRTSRPIMKLYPLEIRTNVDSNLGDQQDFNEL